MVPNTDGIQAAPRLNQKWKLWWCEWRVRILAGDMTASDDAVISPASILTRHSHHQSFHFWFNRGAAWIPSVFGTIELLGDEPSITRLGWCQAWRCRRPLGALCVPDVSPSRRGW